MCIHEKNKSRRLSGFSTVTGLILFGLIYIFVFGMHQIGTRTVPTQHRVEQGLGLSLLFAESPAKETEKIKHLKTINFNSRRRYFQLLNLAVLEKEKKMFVVNPAGVRSRYGVVVYDFYIKEIARFGNKLRFRRPVDLATDGERIYIVDAEENCVKTYNAKGEFLSRFGEFSQPQSIAINPRRKWLYVTDLGNSKVKVFDYEGNYLFDFGGLSRPQRITIDKEGKVYVVEPLSCQVKIFDATGTKLIKKFGDDLLFARPSGIAVDSQLKIYVLDPVLNTIQVFDQRGFPLYSYGKKGNRDGEFNSPNGIYIDEKDTIYIADTNNQRVQIFEIVK